MHIGQRVKQFRTRRGLTQAALAQRAGLSVVYVKKIEAGEKVPSVSTLERLAQALKVTVMDLVK